MSHDTDTVDTGRKLTGRHVLAIFVGGFGIIIGVNLFMAYSAVTTFSGMEVDSSYADSQTFDDRRHAQEALGWTASVEIPGDGTLILRLVDAEGQPVAPAELTALLTRPTHRQEDQTLALTRVNGAFVAPASVGDGQWRLRLTGSARDGTEYRHNITFRHFN
ncbi:FixH family protein [Roseicyclus mahoneyensis]|jgi:nitrogen fixation protein FixH|uniref:Nitrogen fixation protein FixH n=1 Tax=Roseicyclus mahoneyensis TaxID=164332 RepID=A0A316GYM5_9RHOB|nr:FixH family protein [Roseicyclus mahoneyensis]PWK60225.1 nitrogen fixation protein FixH [Roseicyclus mahoneyensis]